MTKRQKWVRHFCIQKDLVKCAPVHLRHLYRSKRKTSMTLAVSMGSCTGQNWVSALKRVCNVYAIHPKNG